MPDQPPVPDFLRTILDTVHAMLFVVDEDVKVLECNLAASKIFDEDRKALLRLKCGEIFHCLNALEGEGCGQTPACRACVVRNSVNAAFRGQSVVRRRCRMERIEGHERKEFFGLIDVSPFVFNGVRMALLQIEDLGEILELSKGLPICAKCHRVRDDEQYWTKLEAYFSAHWGIDFSHGLCPDCAVEETAKADQALGM
jgi:PAS domain-containing protein